MTDLFKILKLWHSSKKLCTLLTYQNVDQRSRIKNFKLIYFKKLSIKHMAQCACVCVILFIMSTLLHRSLAYMCVVYLAFVKKSIDSLENDTYKKKAIKFTVHVRA